jgi:type III restriction enzyme
MPPRTRRQDLNAPPDWKPTQAVPDPILNGPYAEPTAHWIYRDGVPEVANGRRRAGYYFTTKAVAAGQRDLYAEEQFDPIELVNRLRDDVARWRGAEYRGATSVTKDLLQHWSADRAHPLFFCQREAVETLIYLLEIAIPGRLSRTGFQKFSVDATLLATLLKGERPDFTAEDNPNWPRLIDQTGNAGELGLRRLGCKMATGSGKTAVMAMLITWAFLNRARNPESIQFPNGVVVCAPNLTVRERLQVLRPEHPWNSYDYFDLVPSRYKDQLRTGRVLITNWHAFALKSEHREGDASYRVVQKGEETADAFTLDRLGELASRLPVLVLNDEGHHCWRPDPKGPAEEVLAQLPAEERQRLEDEKEEARVWLAGLDRINNCGLLGKDAGGQPNPGVLACVDLSATPFYLANSGYTEGSPFPWLVSDFGLVDAIECGIVKIPRLPVADDTASVDEAGRPDPKYFRLWKNITDPEVLKPHERVGRKPKPEAIYSHAQGALLTLASQWKIQFDKRKEQSQGGHFIPAVMIVVCDNTDIADVFYQHISGERVQAVPDDTKDGILVEKLVYGTSDVLPEFSNEPGHRRTVRIDSKLLAKIETSEGETKDEAALALRELIATVGKAGGPGEQVRCVVSVTMLTEGWDANTVTHILGVRAFGSQLLCEQVVGRGLRRISYKVDPDTGRLPAEYVDVYGIPFSLIPFKGREKQESTADPVYRHIYSVDERASMEIRFPVVESYTYDIRSSGITCDVDALPELHVQDEPTAVYLTPTRGYHDDPNPLASGDYVKQDRTAYYESVRPQQVLFRIAQLIVEDLIEGARGPGAEAAKAKVPGLARHQIFPEVVRILQQYVSQDRHPRKVHFAAGLDERELGMEKYARLVRESVRDEITAAVASADSPLLPIFNRYQPHVTTAGVDEHTARPVADLVKSHLSGAIVRSEDERAAIAILEELDEVECFAPNSRKIGMTIPYRFDDAPHRYEPDFVVRLAGGATVVLEIKGIGGLIHGDDGNRVGVKKAAAEKWITAVNNAGRDGHWAYVYCDDVTRLRDQLLAHVPADLAARLPFRKVPATDAEHFRSCVPLTSLRSLATQFESEQLSLDQWRLAAHAWITWDQHPPFAEGMFVARVLGQAMAPDVPEGAYGLFGPLPADADRNGRTLLVFHAAVRGRDPVTGAAYTVRKYQSERAIDDADGFRHVRITLSASNPSFDPIVFTAADESDVQVLGELLAVLASPPAALLGGARN